MILRTLAKKTESEFFLVFAAASLIF